jgi:hypothetical protein
MNPTFLKKITIALASAAFGILTVFAAPYEKGQKIEGFTAKDQFEKAFTFKPSETKFLLVSHDMDTGKKAVYMANIFGMPGIGRMFAIPKMKKYSHQIILADDAALIAKFPEEKGKLAVLAISGGKVKSIKYWTPATEGVEAY